MADKVVSSSIGDVLYKDMGDGTFAPVVYDGASSGAIPPASAGTLVNGTAGALNADAFSQDVSAYKWVSIQFTGTFVGTLSFQVSNDNTNWVSQTLTNSTSTASAGQTTTTSASVFHGPVHSKYMRVRMTAYTSGSAIITALFSQEPAAIQSIGVNATQNSTWTVQPGNTPNTTAWLANPNTDYPSGATPITAASGNVANATAAATLAGTSGKTTFITGFTVSGAGATAGAVVTVTVTGAITGTLSYTYVAATGAVVANQALNVQFSTPIPASAANTAIVVSCPALGAGNTNNTTVAHGYQL